MKTNSVIEPPKLRPFADRWVMGLGIPLVGIVLPVVVGLVLKLTVVESAFNLSLGLLNTVTLWLGCRYILVRLWQKIPWQLYPFRHLAVEILLISAYTFLVTAIVWSVIDRFFASFFWRKTDFWNVFFPSLIISLIISFIHEGLYFFHQWKHSFVRSENLEKEYYISQFETLKSQVNPHFLFNSLNTLTALIEENAEDAVAYVQKLSDFYRTIIQLRNQQLITVEEEINLIMSYFEIQRQRYGRNLEMNINLVKDVRERLLPPLTLQMLVENAIKHNIISTGRPLKIIVESSGNDYILVKNNLQRREEEEPSAGMGLQNIRNRFGLLTGRPVEIIQSATTFTVAIPLLNM